MKYNNYINSIKLNTKLYIRALLLLVALIPFSAFSDKNIFDNNKEIKKMEQRATNVIQQINNKKKFIETAKLKGKVKYDLPLDKKINLRKTFYIQKESKIHIDIYLLLKLKVAEFISDSSRIKYKRINRSPKIKNIESFNLNIFNKHLDLDLSVQELNNLLLGLNLIDIVNKPYDYSFKGEQLIIIQGGNRCIVNLKSNQITKITLNDGREAEIEYLDYRKVNLNNLSNKDNYILLKSGEELMLPRKIVLKTPNFSMQVKLQNDIIINKTINTKKFIIEDYEKKNKNL